MAYSFGLTLPSVRLVRGLKVHQDGRGAGRQENLPLISVHVEPPHSLVGLKVSVYLAHAFHVS